MQNIIISFNVIAPLMLYMIAGALLSKNGTLPLDLTDKMTKVVSKAFIPFIMFKNIYQADLTGLNANFGFYAAIANLVGWGLCWLVYCRIEKDPAKVGTMVQGGFRSNCVIFGIPVALSLFGEGNTVEVALAIATCVPIYNIFSVLILEIYGQKAAMKEDSKGLDVKVIAKGIATNKLIWAAILGLAVNFSGIDLPQVVDTCVAGMAGVVTPMSFVLLGASFRLQSAKADKKQIIIVTATKLVIYPALFMILPIYWGWSGRVMGAMLLSSAAPTAISSFPMAKAAGCDGDLAGELVAITSVVSIITMFFWIFFLKQAGLM